MGELIDKHELRLALEREKDMAKRLFRERGIGEAEVLVTAFFEIVYRALNRAKEMK